MPSGADLWSRAADRQRAALASGVLEPFRTDIEVVVDGGIPFEVHVVAGLAKKPPGGPANPFLEPEPALVVEPDWPPAHRIVLNRFPVFDRHLLLVTRAFADQDDALDAADFAALDAALAAGPALAFYNGGTGAGASQRHKHLQIVPPFGAALFPTEPFLDGPLPFAVLGADRPADPARAAAECARLRAAAPGPYNLLVTRARMWLVPRAAERWHGLSLNALAFAGSLLVKDLAGLAAIRAAGPLSVLAAVGRPAS